MDQQNIKFILKFRGQGVTDCGEGTIGTGDTQKHSETGQTSKGNFIKRSAFKST